MPNDSLIGLLGLVVAICSIILTVALRLYDYRKQGSQRRIDRVGGALRKLKPKLVEASAYYEAIRRKETNEEWLAPEFYSAVEQTCKTFREEIKNQGLEVDMKKTSPNVLQELINLCVRREEMRLECQKKTLAKPEEKNVYLNDLKMKVFKDAEIKKLIEELIPMVDKWLEKHP